MRDVFITRLKYEYQDLAPVAKRFSEVLVREFYKMIQRNNIALAVPIEQRVKSWSSIEDKLGRIMFHGASLSELHDLVGIRIILLFKRDIEPICQLIENTFRLAGRSDKSKKLSDEQFGYQSIHLIVHPPNSWLTVPSFEEFRRLQAEIQVRTLSQHMWAAVSHKLQYKQEESIPQPIRRTIHRVSALLETVDLEFERVLTERENYRSEIESDKQDRKLNTDVLETLLDSLLPRNNKEGYESYSLILWELEQLGVLTTDQLKKIIKKHISKVLEKDQKTAEHINKNDLEDTRAKAGVFFSYIGLVRMILEEEFGQDYYSQIWKNAEKEL